jgi:hypothetical protein
MCISGPEKAIHVLYSVAPLGDKRAGMMGTPSLGLANFRIWFDVPLVVQFSACHLARPTPAVCCGLAE